jgi:hypothetical protein
MAKKKTLQERIVDKMVADGFTEILPSKSKKYRQFKAPSGLGFYWVGKMGAVRYGKTSTNSRSVSDWWFKAVTPGTQWM